MEGVSCGIPTRFWDYKFSVLSLLLGTSCCYHSSMLFSWRLLNTEYFSLSLVSTEFCFSTHISEVTTHGQLKSACSIMASRNVLLLYAAFCKCTTKTCLLFSTDSLVKTGNNTLNSCWFGERDLFTLSGICKMVFPPLWKVACGSFSHSRLTIWWYWLAWWNIICLRIRGQWHQDSTEVETRIAGELAYGINAGTAGLEAMPEDTFQAVELKVEPKCIMMRATWFSGCL